MSTDYFLFHFTLIFLNVAPSIDGILQAYDVQNDRISMYNFFLTML